MMSPSVKPLKIFCICGTGIAGATVVITSLKEIFADIDVPAIYELGSSMNIRHMMTVEMPDMIVHTSKLPEDFGMPCFSAIPFYTGIWKTPTVNSKRHRANSSTPKSLPPLVRCLPESHMRLEIPSSP